MAKSNGIKDLKQAAKLLNKHAPDGESLAYINPGEARLLKAHGGSGIETLSGVPSYNWFTDAVDWVVDKGSNVVDWLGYGKDGGGKELIKDAGKLGLSTWIALEAKKDREGLNEHEQKLYTDLKSQMAAAEKEFAVNVAGGPAVTNVPDSVTDVASFTDVTLPTMKTTAVAEGGRIGFDAGGNYEAKIKELMARGLSRDLAEALVLSGISEDNYEVMDKAQGGRIGYNLGGIGAMDPRIGYQVGSSDIPGIPGVGKAMRDMDFPTFSEGVKQEFPSNELGVIDTKVQEDVSTTGGNQIQNSAMALIQSGVVDSAEALSAAYTLNAVEADFPGVTNVALQIIKAGRVDNINDAISQAVTIIEGSKQIQSTVGSTDFSEFIPTAKAYGGRIGAKEGGIMPLLNLGGMEKDYRQDGGFVPIGRREKADDVPARLSKNEFVFTADAVRNAGGGDIDKGAQRMYNVMKNLEAGGEISEQSQGQV